MPDPRRWKALALLCTAGNLVLFAPGTMGFGVQVLGCSPMLGSRREPDAAPQAEPAIA
jgi:hypothetical protein